MLQENPTPWIHAIRGGFFQEPITAQTLTERYDPHGRGLTPLHAVIFFIRFQDNAIDLSERLLAAGAQINEPSSAGFSALQAAAAAGMRLIVRHLLQAGADFRFQDRQEGWTALHLAADVDTAAEILRAIPVPERKTMIDMCDHHGKTAIEYAPPEVKEYLRQVRNYPESYLNLNRHLLPHWVYRRIFFRMVLQLINTVLLTMLGASTFFRWEWPLNRVRAIWVREGNPFQDDIDTADEVARRAERKKKVAPEPHEYPYPDEDEAAPRRALRWAEDRPANWNSEKELEQNQIDDEIDEANAAEQAAMAQEFFQNFVRRPLI